MAEEDGPVLPSDKFCTAPPSNSLPEPPANTQSTCQRRELSYVVVVELCGGILAGARAVELLRLPLVATYTADVDKDSTLVALHKFGEAKLMNPPELFTDKCIAGLADTHPTAFFFVTANLQGKQDADVLRIAKALVQTALPAC